MHHFNFGFAGLIALLFASSAQAQNFFSVPVQNPVQNRVVVSTVRPVFTEVAPTINVTPTYTTPVFRTQLSSAPGVWVTRVVEGVERHVLLGSTRWVPPYEMPDRWVYKDADTYVRVRGGTLPGRYEETWLMIGEPVAPKQVVLPPSAPIRYSTINRADLQDEPIRHSTIYVDRDAFDPAHRSDSDVPPTLQEPTPALQPVAPADRQGQKNEWRPGRSRNNVEPTAPKEESLQPPRREFTPEQDEYSSSPSSVAWQKRR